MTLRDARFLPFDQIDEDDSRAELDRTLLVDVLGLPPELCDEGGTMDRLRWMLAREPQIHGGKNSRVVFTADGGERSVKRTRERRYYVDGVVAERIRAADVRLSLRFKGSLRWFVASIIRNPYRARRAMARMLWREQRGPQRWAELSEHGDIQIEDWGRLPELMLEFYPSWDDVLVAGCQQTGTMVSMSVEPWG